jgi:hypothetical protein
VSGGVKVEAGARHAAPTSSATGESAFPSSLSAALPAPQKIAQCQLPPAAEQPEAAAPADSLLELTPMDTLEPAMLEPVPALAAPDELFPWPLFMSVDDGDRTRTDLDSDDPML